MINAVGGCACGHCRELGREGLRIEEAGAWERNVVWSKDTSCSVNSENIVLHIVRRLPELRYRAYHTTWVIRTSFPRVCR